MDREMEVPIVRLEIVRDGSAGYFRDKISSAEGAAAWMRKIIGDSCREQVVAVCFDAGMRASNINVVSMGSANMSLCPASEVFKAAILSNASRVMIFHNHPSGDPEPSEADIRVTAKLREAGELLELELIDHIIIGCGKRYYSFKENGLL